MTSAEYRDEAHTPVELTLEEMKVMKECKWNSIMYRGVPLGLCTLAISKTIDKARFWKFSGLFYTGMFTIGFFFGVGSYAKTCAKKIMALENSVIGDKFRAKLAQEKKRDAQTAVGELSTVPGDFEDEYSELSVPTNKEVDDPFESPLNKRLKEGSRWDEIRKQAHTPTSTGKGISYQELRLRNRSNQGDYKSLTPEEESDLENKKQPSSSEMATFNAKSFDDDKPTALDFSKSDESRIPLLDKHRDNARTDTGEKPQKSFTQGLPHKNKYGDEVL